MPNKITDTRISTPLVVDLDGTLLRSDSLYECANNIILKNPLFIFQILLWLLKGIPFLKLKLFACCSIDPAFLPYNSALLEWLKKQKESGRIIILATASHKNFADEIANFIGLFSEVIATCGNINLKGERKRDALINRFGEKGFDYVGDANADIPVWLVARKSYIVGSSSIFNNHVQRIVNFEKIFSDGKHIFSNSMIRALRPHQWVKNFLIFLPLIASHRLTDIIAFKDACIAFLIFGLAASSVYILNDLCDVNDDRRHHSKRNRPFAAGDLSLVAGWILWPSLILTALSLSVVFLPFLFSCTLACYFIITLCYSMHIKKIAILDTLTLACLYTIRIIAGGAAISTHTSFWLLAFSIFVFLSLAFVKRYSEISFARINSYENNIRGRGYVTQDLELVSNMGIASGYLSVLVLALYIQDPHTAYLYSTPQIIWLACPIVLYWISRAWLLSHRGLVHEDPIIFAIRDKTSWVAVVFITVIFILAKIS